MNIHKLVGQSAIVAVFPISLILEGLTICSRFVLCFEVGQCYHHPYSSEN